MVFIVQECSTDLAANGDGIRVRACVGHAVGHDSGAGSLNDHAMCRWEAGQGSSSGALMSSGAGGETQGDA